MNGQILLGGAPFSLLRLSPAGARLVDGWFRGDPVTATPAHQELARRLLQRGMAHPRLDPTTVDPAVTDRTPLAVVIPVHDDRRGLRRTIAGLGPSARLTIVDDASDPPIEAMGSDVERDPMLGEDERAVRIIRLDTNRGPAGARNAGLLRHLTDPDESIDDVVALIDAGIVTSLDDLRRLAAHFIDPEVVAVAPRVRSGSGTTALARYERRHSPLDLGDDPGPVGQGRRLTYVPTACLLVRRSALSALVDASSSQQTSSNGGDRPSAPFDETLRFGEDVDLVWRLQRLGTIRYDPSIVVDHPPRSDLGGFVRQRFGYGSSAGPLAFRHGAALAPLRLSRWSALVVTMTALAATPTTRVVRLLAATASIVTVVGSGEHLVQRLPDDLPDRRIEALRIVIAGHVGAANVASRGLTRWAWPATLALLIVAPSLRRPLAATTMVAPVTQVVDPSDPLATVGLRLIDDVAYGAGVWAGVFKECVHSRWRALRALRPVISSG